MNKSLLERIIEDQKLNIENLKEELLSLEAKVECLTNDKVTQTIYINELENELSLAEKKVNFNHDKLRDDIANLYYSIVRSEDDE